MVNSRRWLLRDDGDAANVLEAALVGSYEGLHHLLFRGPWGSTVLTNCMKVTIKAWDQVQLLMQPEGGSRLFPAAPLWFILISFNLSLY